MRLTFLGTCSGTEPMPGRQHTSLAIEHEDRLFWFDAGECCSRSAHLGGIDLSRSEAIFISHTHMDHIGGLPNLLWTIRKLCSVSPGVREHLTGREIEVFTPDPSIFAAILTILRGTEGGFSTVFSLRHRRCEEGILYERDGVRVRALRNQHGGAALRSFSFRLDAGGGSIVFSGDVTHIGEVAPLIEGCDLLLMETGHHKVEEVCGFLQQSGLRFGRLVFVHHGRAILADPEGQLAAARGILGDRVSIAEDGQCLEV